MKVCVVCDEQLVKIVQGVPGVDEVRAHPATIYPNEFDWCCSVMSLPLAFGTELSTIPSSANLLVTSEQSRQKWADRLRGLDGLKVGVAWTGNKALAANAIRSIPIETLARLFPIPGIVWVNLQKGEAAGELKGKGWPVHDWMDDAQDLMDTAALIDCLDLVITVDTSIVHLAGVLNRPTWLLNRYDTEWRWHKEREDSPWYPSVRVFRQSMPNDWSGVIGNVAEDLRHKLAS